MRKGECGRGEEEKEEEVEEEEEEEAEKQEEHPNLTHSFYRSYNSRWQYSIRHKQVGIKRTKIRNGEY